MGGEPYWYFVKYQANIQKALDQLREREFTAGRYNPVLPFLEFPVDASSPAPGAQHNSIEEAFEDADADGTRSILDIHSIADEPDFCVAVPLDDEVLESIYGTTEPTHDMFEQNLDFLDAIERGHAVYATVYTDGEPSELLFAGYSFD